MVEVFGRSVREGSAEVGMGLKAFRDPAFTHGFDFPEWSVGHDDHLVPELVVDHVAG